MGAFRLALWLMLAAALSGAVAALTIPPVLSNKARTIQLVKVVDSAVAALTGEAYVPVGSPQRIFLADDRSIIPGEGPAGEVLVDEEALRRSGTYPLQIKTVNFVAQILGLGSSALGVLSSLLLIRTRKRGPSPEALRTPA